MQKRTVLTLMAGLIVIIGLLPVISMLLKSIIIDGHLSLNAYYGLLNSKRQWTLLKHSLTLASLVTILTTVIGVPTGILLGKTNLFLRKLFLLILTVPLLLPPYIIAVSYSDLLGQEGLLTPLLGSTLMHHINRWLFGLPGCTIVLFSAFLPIPVIFTIAFLRTVNPHMEEAARLSASWGKVLKGITLPMILPGIIFSALLVFLLTFGEFGVPNFLRYGVFPVESFTQFSAFYDFQAATATSMPMAIITFFALLIEACFLREKTYQIQTVQDNIQTPVICLQRSHIPLTIATATMVLCITIVPIFTLVIKSANPAAYAWAINRAGNSLIRSITYATTGATLLTFSGFLTGYLIQTRSLKIWRAVDSLTIFLFALPGTVIGIGLISLWNTPWTNFIYASPLIILLGYLAKYTAITSRISINQLAKIPPSMEEAAQITGASWSRRMIFIVLPLSRHGLITAWLAGYVFSLRDTAITMMVYPAGHDTLPVRIFTLMANGSSEMIASLCIILIIATLLPLGIILLLPMFKRLRYGH